MQGLELSRLYYDSFGRKMIDEQPPEIRSRIAAGLVGPGSDCFGFDDELSRDHDFGAGFCIWLTDDDFESFGFGLSRAYAKLPKEFMGFPKGSASSYAPARYGVRSIGDFYLPLIGSKTAPVEATQWLCVPSYSLAAATNGEVFCDGPGVFSEIRNTLLNGMPEDVRLKKIAAHCINAAQSGQYNFPRCIKHGEIAAAVLAASRFAESYASVIYLLNGKYSPFYKWAIRGLGKLELFGETADKLTFILTGENSPHGLAVKEKVTEELCEKLACHLRTVGLSAANGSFLEPHAYSIQNKIKDNNIRNLHIMEGAD